VARLPGGAPSCAFFVFSRFLHAILAA
jgi:hypothetical protein